VTKNILAALMVYILVGLIIGYGVVPNLMGLYAAFSTAQTLSLIPAISRFSPAACRYVQMLSTTKESDWRLWSAWAWQLGYRR